MPLILLLILSTLVYTQANAQLVAPAPPKQRQVIDTNMVIQFGNHRIEVIPGKRAVKQLNGQYSLVTAETSDTISKDRLAVGYSYASSAQIMLNGELNVKLKTGYSLTALGSTSEGAKLLIPPDLFVLSASTPHDLVRKMKVLQTNPAVDWVEPFILRNQLVQ